VSSIIVIDRAYGRDVYLKAVTQVPSLLAYVPLEYRDLEMCVAAARERNSTITSHVPRAVAEKIKASNEDCADVFACYSPSKRYRDILMSWEEPETVPEALPVYVLPARAA
jgi:hypothetical protein